MTSHRHATRLLLLEGLTSYGDAHRLQLCTVEQRKANEVQDTLILLEHPPLITLGKNAAATGVLASQAELGRLGIEVHRTERGGQATYHGPGQIVGYPVMDLHARGFGVARYVSLLEDVMIDSANRLGVPAQRRKGLTGIFAATGAGGKLGAIGVRISRGITFHGFAFNVAPDLSHYQLIVPCGMTDTPVSSVRSILQEQVSMEQGRNAILASYESVFNTRLETASCESL